jgi:GT2 family glycosyltransferase
MTPVSIVIPTYNGLELLKRIVPSVLDVIKSGEDHEILVVDDGSEDGTGNYLESYFPQVKAIVLERNMGFGKACNIGASKARNRLIVLLNNDVLIDSDFLSNVLLPLEKQEGDGQKNFAVTCKVLKDDRKTLYHYRNEGFFSSGEIVIKPLPDERGSTFFASGVMMVFRKELFLELGGFDDLYHPFYWEDVDLCYRALKKGYRILYEPEGVIYHKDQATIVFRKKGRAELFFSKMYARIIQERNQYLFTWKNILDRGLIFRHILWIPIHLILSFRNKDHIFKSIGFLFALMRLKRALTKRGEERKKEYLFEDRQILYVR